MGDERLSGEGEESTGSGLDRRGFIVRAGIGTAVAGAAWVAPSVVGTSVAFAQGSDGGGDDGGGDDGGGDDGGEEETPTTIDPGLTQYECSAFPWPQSLSEDPTASGVRNFYPITASLDPHPKLISVTSTVVGPNAPSVHRNGHANTASDYRNLMSHTAPYDGAAALPGSGRGLILVQDNAAGGNTSESSVVNYQEVTVTFDTTLAHVVFWVYGFSANASGASDTSSSTHRDVLSFDDGAQKVAGAVPLDGYGTFSNPFRLRSAAPASWDTRFQVRVPGPLQSFTMRYATVGGTGEQSIKLSDFSFGMSCVESSE